MDTDADEEFTTEVGAFLVTVVVPRFIAEQVARTSSQSTREIISTYRERMHALAREQIATDGLPRDGRLRLTAAVLPS